MRLNGVSCLSATVVRCSARYVLYAEERDRDREPADRLLRRQHGGKFQRHPGPSQLMLPGRYTVHHVRLLARIRRHLASAAQERRYRPLRPGSDDTP